METLFYKTDHLDEISGYPLMVYHHIFKGSITDPDPRQDDDEDDLYPDDPDRDNDDDANSPGIGEDELYEDDDETTESIDESTGYPPLT